MAETSSKGKAARSEIRDFADAISKDLGADVLLYNAPILRHFDQRVIELCAKRRRRDKVLLLLVTEGGDADAAYRIATCLQQRYPGGFILFVPGYCKSAGTLVALGAHQLVLSMSGELGPLDVQLSQKDELFGTQSGLTATASLRTLNREAFQAFEYFLLQTTGRSLGAITTKTAAEIAARMACGLFTPVYQQVDPMLVGEAGRALKIAQDYGRRLALTAQNLQGDIEETLEHLVSHYPTHGFVIDLREAKRIFKRVRESSPTEAALVGCLGPIARWPTQRDEEPFVTYLSSEKSKRSAKAKKGSEKHAEQKESRPAAKTRAGARTVPEAGGGGQSPVPQIAGIGRGGRRP